MSFQKSAVRLSSSCRNVRGKLTLAEKMRIIQYSPALIIGLIDVVQVMTFAITTLTKQSNAVVVMPLRLRLSLNHSLRITALISRDQLDLEFEGMGAKPPFFRIVGGNNEDAPLLLLFYNALDERFPGAIEGNPRLIPKEDFWTGLDRESDLKA